MPDKFRYFAFEGVFGSGKSTQAPLLVAKLKCTFPGVEVYLTHEPGGSEISDEIRRVVQGMQFKSPMEHMTEFLLYSASRTQDVPNLIEPVLADGGFAVTDRSLYSSGAFQGGGREMGVDRILNLSRMFVNRWPDVVLILNRDLDVAMQSTKDKLGDKFELMGRDFAQRCLEAYKYISRTYPNVYEVEGNGSIEEVEQRVWTIVSGLLGLK